MAMLISKFHRLIQSKVVWYVILVIIVIAFVGLYIQWPGDEERAAAANSAGMLNGEHVPNQEFQNAYANTWLAVALAAGGRPNLNGDLSDRLKDASWQRLITLRKARELGLTASDNEVRMAIAGNPGFADNGQFSPQRYMAFAQGFLRQELGISGARFEEHVREEIILQKLQRMVSQSVLISPYELQRTFSTLVDTFDLEFAMITTNDVKKTVRPARKELQTFFEQDPKAFTLPARVKVKYAAFPIADYMADFSFSDDEVAEYYEDNLDDYTETVTTTNQVPLLTSAEGEEAFEDQVREEQVITPLEEVQDEILAKLIREAALNKALDEATDFVVALAPNRKGQSVPFETQAKKAKRDVLTLESFTLDEELTELKVGPDFNEIAFSLRPNPDEYFSDAIAGEEAVYVLALEERIPARVPEFAEVEDQVREIATAVAKKEALDELVQSVRESAEQAVRKGNTFASVLESSGLVMQTATNVSAMTGIEDEQFASYSDLIMRAAITSNPGEIPEAIETEEGFILCHIASRTPGDASLFETYRANLVTALRQDRLGVNFGAFQEWLLNEADFQPRSFGEWDDEEPEEEDEEYADEELYKEEIPVEADETAAE
ncbi:MAG TPA: peptidylprolyl isomerase [Kiritimatiellia bacterium]|nr:peptidylprolyl isomerase [Kiritimatiellia bacterium]HPA78846.1 peptidylprolyl isomerase [Kiritimatiellia bacterium]